MRNVIRDPDNSDIEPPIGLTDREKQIAEYAADKAVKKMVDSFYKEVGKTVVGRFLIILGALATGFALGKGIFAKLML